MSDRNGGKSLVCMNIDGYKTRGGEKKQCMNCHHAVKNDMGTKEKIAEMRSNSANINRYKSRKIMISERKLTSKLSKFTVFSSYRSDNRL